MTARSQHQRPTAVLHHTQVQRAFSSDYPPAAKPAVLTEAKGRRLAVHYLDGTDEAIHVSDGHRLAETLARPDLCQISGRPLLMVNTHYRVLGIATGPAAPPSRLVVLIVSRMENGSVVELLSGSEDQPSWQLFALTP